VNIYSGEGGLGSALTNPTELARKKGVLHKKYPVRFRGKFYLDAEAAYQKRKTGHRYMDDLLMKEIICAKFMQHSYLFGEVCQRGGVAFLEKCDHLLPNHRVAKDLWQGRGMNSRFIRNLVGGFKLALRRF
jgi:hypothetical protein